MTINAVIFQAEAEPFVPPPDQAELALNAASYSGDENTVIQFTILRTVDTTERVSVDWAITNATVTPSSGAQIFEIGSAQEVIAVTAPDIGPTEVGQLTISNPQNLTTPSNPPALINPSSATFTVNDLDFFINPIGPITLPVSQTHDMSQYIVDPSNVRTSTWFTGLAGFASYDSVTELLTGDLIGLETGLTFHISNGIETKVSNVFQTDVTDLPARSVYYIAEFNTGQSQPHGDVPDGMQIYCHRDDDPFDFIGFRNGGCDANSPSDVKILQSEVTPATGAGPGGDLVLPRKGNYMMRSAIYGDKDYNEWSIGSGQDRPRCVHTPVHPDYNKGLFNPFIPYDLTTWVGVSIYLPSNIETSPENKRNALSEVTSEGSSSTHFGLELDAPENPNGNGRWTLRFWDNPNSAKEGGGGGAENQPNFDLGSYADDKGMWTDFVFQLRFNPFVSPRDGAGPSNASVVDPTYGRNQSYAHDRGIFRVWKTTGPVNGNGDRTFVEITSSNDGVKLPIINGRDANNNPVGVGLVPYVGYDVNMSYRQYRPTWRELSDGSEGDQNLQGPQFIWWDCFYMGQASRDGTDFTDVNPSQLSQP